MPVLSGGGTKISSAHLRGNVQFYGSRLTEASLAKRSESVNLEIGRYRPHFYLLSLSLYSIFSLSWATFHRVLNRFDDFRISFDSCAFNAPLRSHVRLNYNPHVQRVRNNCSRFIVAIRITRVQQNASQRDVINLASGWALQIERVGRNYIRIYIWKRSVALSCRDRFTSWETTNVKILAYFNISICIQFVKKQRVRRNFYMND